MSAVAITVDANLVLLAIVNMLFYGRTSREVDGGEHKESFEQCELASTAYDMLVL